jgi:hypothetical protein
MVHLLEKALSGLYSSQRLTVHISAMRQFIKYVHRPSFIKTRELEYVRNTVVELGIVGSGSGIRSLVGGIKDVKSRLMRRLVYRLHGGMSLKLAVGPHSLYRQCASFA